jgi:hypothetical protein
MHLEVWKWLLGRTRRRWGIILKLMLRGAGCEDWGVIWNWLRIIYSG